MRQHLFRKLAAAVVAATLTVTATAQDRKPAADAPPVIKPVPNVTPAPAAPAPAATPAPMPPVTIMPVPVTPAVPTHVVPVAPPAADCGTPACNSGCGPTAKKSVFGKLYNKVAIGPGTVTPVACSCHAADKTFVFGSCKQFFNPGRTCPGISYAAPYGAPANNCCGPFTFLNR